MGRFLGLIAWENSRAHLPGRIPRPCCLGGFPDPFAWEDTQAYVVAWEDTQAYVVAWEDTQA